MAQAKTLTQNEIDQVLRYIATKKMGYRDRVIFLMTLWSGMRIKEVASLRIRNVRNEDGSIKGEIRLTQEMTKGRHARVVFIPEKLKTELKQYLADRSTKFPDLPLFHTATGKAFSANTLCQHFYWLYKAAGVSGASSHSGRKTFCTSLANKGISIHILASLAGHRNIAVTSRYLIANDELKRNAVELV
jgi:integrase/recombinase XerD